MNVNITLPAGEYYIGDLCYLFKEHDDWLEFIDKYLKGTEDPYNQEYKSEKYFSHNTEYGDGIYFDQFGNEYPVDSGSIGALPKELATKTDDGCLLKTFDDDFECSFEDGTFYFGEIEIETGDSIDEDDYDSLDEKYDWN